MKLTPGEAMHDLETLQIQPQLPWFEKVFRNEIEKCGYVDNSVGGWISFEMKNRNCPPVV